MITPSYSPTATERVLPRMALDFTTGVLDSRVTIARALNTATRVNSSGLIETVNANLPRFDYNPVTLAAKGLLIEEQRRNLLTYSDQFNNANWSKSVTITPDTVTSPDGTTNADTATKAATAFQSVFQSVTSVSGTVYTASMYFKANTFTRASIAVISGTTDVRYWYDLSAKTVGGAISTFTTGYVGSSIEDAGNGWLRCTLTVTAQSTLTNAYFYPDKADTATAGSVFIYGAQLEAGSFASSYIPTTNTALTRNADDVTMTGTNFTSWYNASAGTFISTFRSATSTASVLVTDASGSGRPLYIVSGGVVRIFDGTAPINAGGTYTFGTVASAGSSYGGGTMSCALNGGTVGTGAFDGSMGTSGLYIGRNPAQPNEYIKGHIQKVAFYPMRFSDRELQAFSK
jgi:hypothetical protein